MTSRLHADVAAIVIALSLAGASAPARAQQPGEAAAVKINAHDIGGVVTSAHGREAGVWVIAETSDLPTRFIKIVVTDDHGRYVLPDLPEANYRVWVRGYGLVDSPEMTGSRARFSTSAPSSRRPRPRRPTTIRRSIGIRCSKCRTRASSAARATFRRRSASRNGSSF